MNDRPIIIIHKQQQFDNDKGFLIERICWAHYAAEDYCTCVHNSITNSPIEMNESIWWSLQIEIILLLWAFL